MVNGYKGEIGETGLVWLKDRRERSGGQIITFRIPYLAINLVNNIDCEYIFYTTTLGLPTFSWLK